MFDPLWSCTHAESVIAFISRPHELFFPKKFPIPGLVSGSPWLPPTTTLHVVPLFLFVFSLFFFPQTLPISIPGETFSLGFFGGVQLV